MKNIRIFCALLVLNLMAVSGNAQLGIRGGINTSSISISDGDFNVGARTGIQAGLTYTVGISPRISLRPGAIYSVKGFELKDLGQSGELSYLEVPISFIFHLLGNSSGLYFELGPYAGAIIGDDGPFEVDYSNLDLGLNVGVGLKIGRFGIGLTYGYGIANIVDGEFNSEEAKFRNKNIGLFGTVYF